MKTRRGFTLIEVLAALSILAVVALAVVGTLILGMRESARAGRTTQAARIIAFAVAGLTSGDPRFFPASGETEIAWDYGKLKDTFPTLASEGDFDPDDFKLTIEDKGLIDSAAELGVSTHRWRIEVCHRGKGGGGCVDAYTLATPGGGS